MNIQQCDGNDSCLSLITDDEEHVEDVSLPPGWKRQNQPQIPTISNTRVQNNTTNNRKSDVPRVLTKVQTSNKLAEAATLPSILEVNARSLRDKLNNLAIEVKKLAVEITFINEIWEKHIDVELAEKAETIFQLHGLSYLSSPRNGKRGGGVALIFDSSKLEIKVQTFKNPNQLEIMWAVAKAKFPAKGNKNIPLIITSIYSPPRSRKKKYMLDHLIEQCMMYKSRFGMVNFLIAGDINCLNIAPFIEAVPGLVQIANVKTLGKSIIDVIITNKPNLFVKPIALSPVEVDEPGKGKPSDHDMLLTFPITQEGLSQQRKVTKKSINQKNLKISRIQYPTIC